MTLFRSILSESINASIASQHYFTAAQGCFGAEMYLDGTTPMPQQASTLDSLMFCVLVLKDGTLVTGKADCSELDDVTSASMKDMARADALEKLKKKFWAEVLPGAFGTQP